MTHVGEAKAKRDRESPGTPSGERDKEKKRLRGIVRARPEAGDPGGGRTEVFRHTELEIDGTPRIAPQLRRPFDLEVDGELVAVDFSMDVEPVPLHVVKERWEDVENDPGCAPFREDAPAPHTKVKLSSFVLVDGDAIEIWGPTESSAGAAGFRESATREIASIDARVLGRGAEGTERIDELEKERALVMDREGGAPPIRTCIGPCDPPTILPVDSPMISGF